MSRHPQQLRRMAAVLAMAIKFCYWKNSAQPCGWVLFWGKHCFTTEAEYGSRNLDSYSSVPQCLCGELLRTNPDYRHHPASFAEFSTMRKEALGVARSTAIYDHDVLRPHTHSFELTTVRRNQIKMDLRP